LRKQKSSPLDNNKFAMSENLFKEERLQIIMELISSEKKVFVNELADRFKVSSSSIRLDLAELEKRGLINRTHGGAIISENVGNDIVLGKSFLNLREEINKEEKLQIGCAVVKLINDGDSIMMDGGSTIYYISKCLGKKRGLTIITTSIHILPIIMEIPDAKVYLTGGLVHRDFEDLIGDISTSSIQRFKPDYVIMGIDGASIRHGYTTTDPSMAQIKRQMLSVSSKSIMVLDSSKFGKVCLHHVREINEVDTVVTDENIPDDYKNFLQKANVNVVIA